MKDIRAAFFRHIREEREYLETFKRKHKKKGFFINVCSPERVWEFIQNIGLFLLEEGVISRNDLNVAERMAEDYKERVHELVG